MKAKPYKAKTLSGAQARVRYLEKQCRSFLDQATQYHEDRVLMAKLAAKGPAFYNPLEAMAAEKRRDEILGYWCKLNPDGSPKGGPR